MRVLCARSARMSWRILFVAVAPHMHFIPSKTIPPNPPLVSYTQYFPIVPRAQRIGNFRQLYFALGYTSRIVLHARTHDKRTLSARSLDCMHTSTHRRRSDSTPPPPPRTKIGFDRCAVSIRCIFILSNLLWGGGGARACVCVSAVAGKQRNYAQHRIMRE